MEQKMMYDYFYHKAFTKNRPVSVMIELLTKCNLNCEHCYLPSHSNKGLDFDTIKLLFRDLRKLGIMNVSLTGGEIFLREDIFEIIELARRNQMRVFLLSNGTLLNKSKVTKLINLNIAEFPTTIFSMDPEIHDSITGVKGSLNKLLKNLKFFDGSNISIRIKTPLMKKNVSGYMEIYKYCKENNYDFLTSPLIFSKNDGDESPKNLRICDKTLKQILPQIDSINRNDHLHMNDVPCAALFYSFAIDSFGDVYPCNSFFCKIGNIFNEHINDIWYESPIFNQIKEIRNKDLKKCNKCAYYTKCDRCPGMVYMEKKDFYSCDEFAKKLARIRYTNEKTKI